MQSKCWLRQKEELFKLICCHAFLYVFDMEQKEEKKWNHLDMKELNIFIRQSIFEANIQNTKRETERKKTTLQKPINMYNSKTIPSTIQLYLELFCFAGFSFVCVCRAVPCVLIDYSLVIVVVVIGILRKRVSIIISASYIHSQVVYTRPISWSTFFAIYFEIQKKWLFFFPSSLFVSKQEYWVGCVSCVITSFFLFLLYIFTSFSMAV